MPRIDFRSHRLYVEPALATGTEIRLQREQTHYLRNVLRLKPGAGILVFNGRDGEWQAEIGDPTGRDVVLTVLEQTRPQSQATDLHYLFAPLKHERLDYMVQKAVEMGASLLQPVLTQHAQVSRINVERMRANVIEAAEQCGVLNVPAVAEPTKFATMLVNRKPDRLLVFCDETAEVTDPLAALAAARPKPAAALPLTAATAADTAAPIAIIIGPEGGFSEQERSALLQLPHTVRLSLGPRILRADTAAVAALALVQASLGDWR